MFIDSHCHLSEEVFRDDLDLLMERAQAAGVETIIDICTDAKTLERGLEIRQHYPSVHLVAATTPHDVSKDGEAFFPVVEKHASDLVAIGETGLDYYYEHSPRDVQQEFLRRYLHLAHSLDLPVVIHCRDAFEDFFRILDDSPKVRGVLHCFTGTLAEAREVVARGWFLSLSGIVTFKKSEELREVARETPLDQLLIETDAPYLAPQSRRGKRNEPSYVPEVANVIAIARNQPLNIVAEATTANARRLFLHS